MQKKSQIQPTGRSIFHGPIARLLEKVVTTSGVMLVDRRTWFVMAEPGRFDKSVTHFAAVPATGLIYLSGVTKSRTMQLKGHRHFAEVEHDPPGQAVPSIGPVRGWVASSLITD